MGDYSFIKEVVKEKPFNKKAFLLKIAGLAAAGIFFGVIAAFTFAFLLPTAAESAQKKQSSSQVNIEHEETEVQESAAVSEEKKETEEAAQVIEVPAELGLSDYKKIYQEMVQASESASRAMVAVVGITDNMDWFNNTYENQKQISGLVIVNAGEELYVLTEYRGVETVDRIQVIFWNGTSVDARFQKNDPNTGLCVLKIPVSDIDSETLDGLATAPLGNSNTLHQGDPVIALGSPMGYNNSIATGMLTSVSNQVSGWDKEYSILTTDILGTEDGSGVLLNLDGKVIGIILQSYASSSNMVTCVGVSEIVDLMESLSNNEEIPYIGVKGQEVTAEISDKTGIPRGVYINEIKVDSPAMLAGIMNGDVIVKVKGQEVKTVDAYSKIIEECSSEQVIPVTVMRKGVEGYKEIVFDVTVGAL